jgi:hypothetical protein
MNDMYGGETVVGAAMAVGDGSSWNDLDGWMVQFFQVHFVLVYLILPVCNCAVTMRQRRQWQQKQW